MAPVTTHSLSSLPWLPAQVPRGPPVAVPDTSLAQQQVHRRQWKAPETTWDAEDFLSYSDDEEDDDDNDNDGRLRRYMARAMSGNSVGREAEAAATSAAIVKFFESVRGDVPSNAVYELVVRVRGVTIPGVGPITRTVRIPASLSLHDLADRVLIVAFAYTRGEHGYIFNLPSAAYAGRARPPFDYDIGFLPEGAGTVDIACHSRNVRGAVRAVASQKVLVCDLLRAPGDTVRWEYDLGDRLDHTITLQRILPPDPKTTGGRRVVLVSGTGAGIPENPGSLVEHAKRVANILQGGPAAVQASREMHDSAQNYHDHLVFGAHLYNPTYFNREGRQRAIDEAMDAPKGGDYGGFRNMIPFSPGALEAILAPSKKSSPASVATGTKALTATKASEPRDVPADTPACADCGTRLSQPSWCGRCHKVAYCNVTCQRHHWMNGHRAECVADGAALN